MKRLNQTRHTLKHRQTGKVLPNQIPAFNTHNTPYKRILPPMRDQHIIDTRLLAKLINERTSGNLAVIIPGGIRLNQNSVMIEEGIARGEQLKFRFVDLWDLLMNLKQEMVLKCSIEELRAIKRLYYE